MKLTEKDNTVLYSNSIVHAFILARQIALTLCGNWVGQRLSQQETLDIACGHFSLPGGWVNHTLRASIGCPEGKASVPKVLLCWNPAGTNFLSDRATSVTDQQKMSSLKNGKMSQSQIPGQVINFWRAD